MVQAASVYIHIPFCRSKCGYCDFASFASLEHLYKDYVRALTEEIRGSPRLSAGTLYFGGGTPSLLPVEMTSDIMAAVRKRFLVQKEAEITLEANPATVSASGLATLKSIGINRLSVGVQSFDTGTLEMLGRDYRPRDAVEAVEAARKAGFTNLSVDIMTAMPQQTKASMINDLKTAVEFQPEHLSVYQLTLHEESTMQKELIYKAHKMPGGDVQAEFYETAIELLADNGYGHYEISNFAKPGKECRHNLAAWLGEQYLGLGSGAHSFFQKRRFANPKKPEDYIRSIANGGISTRELTGKPKDELIEYLLMRLRLVGREVNFSEINEKFGIDFSHLYREPIEKLGKNNFLAVNNNGFKLTSKGLLFLNNILLEFI